MQRHGTVIRATASTPMTDDADPSCAATLASPCPRIVRFAAGKPAGLRDDELSTKRLWVATGAKWLPYLTPGFLGTRREQLPYLEP